MNPLAWLSADFWMVKLGGVLALLAAIGFGLWYLHHDGYKSGRNEVLAQWNSYKNDQAEAQKAALAAYTQQISQAEAQHDKDQALIDRLHTAAGRVRIHLPACAGNGAAGAQDQNGAAGILSTRVDASFAELQDRAASLFARCDQLNIDAIGANAAATVK